MNTPPELCFTDIAARYCARQEQTPAGLLYILQAQRRRYHPDGWVLLECEMMDSSWLGTMTILPYGPHNTLKSIPDHPVSPRGLASDMSSVVAVLPAANLPPSHTIP